MIARREVKNALACSAQGSLRKRTFVRFLQVSLYNLLGFSHIVFQTMWIENRLRKGAELSSAAFAVSRWIILDARIEKTLCLREFLENFHDSFVGERVLACSLCADGILCY